MEPSGAQQQQQLLLPGGAMPGDGGDESNASSDDDEVGDTMYTTMIGKRKVNKPKRFDDDGDQDLTGKRKYTRTKKRLAPEAMALESLQSLAIGASMVPYEMTPTASGGAVSGVHAAPLTPVGYQLPGAMVPPEAAAAMAVAPAQHFLQKPPPDIVDQVRVVTDPWLLSKTQVLDSQGMPCEDLFSWEQLMLPLPPSPSAMAYVADALWKMAEGMHCSLSPRLSRDVLGLRGEWALGENEEPPPMPEMSTLAASDPAFSVPELGTVYRRWRKAEEERRRRKRVNVDLVPDSSEIGDVLRELGNGGRIRVLWELTHARHGGVKVPRPMHHGAERSPAIFYNRPALIDDQGKLPSFSLAVTFSDKDGDDTVDIRLKGASSVRADGESVWEEGDRNVDVTCSEGWVGASTACECRVLKFWELWGGKRDGEMPNRLLKKEVHEENDNDEVLAELQQTQQLLLRLMWQNLAKARELTRPMAQSFEDVKQCYPRKVEEKDVLVRYKAKLEQEEESRAAERSREMEEANATCAVCRDNECGGRNLIVFCERCLLPVHMQCYPVPSPLPAGPWYCASCQDMNSMGVPPFVTMERRCELCPNISRGWRVTDCGKWVHVECCRWFGLIDRFGGVRVIEPRLHMLRQKFSDAYTCCVSGCSSPNSGAMVPCAHPECSRFFHVTCGRRVELEMYHGSKFRVQAWKGYCHIHSQKLRFEEALRIANSPHAPATEDQYDVNTGYNYLWEQQEQVERGIVRRGAGKRPPKPYSWMEAMYIITARRVGIDRMRDYSIDPRRRGYSGCAYGQGGGQQLLGGTPSQTQRTADGGGASGGVGGGHSVGKKRGPYKKTRERLEREKRHLYLQYYKILQDGGALDAVDMHRYNTLRAEFAAQRNNTEATTSSAPHTPATTPHMPSEGVHPALPGMLLASAPTSAAVPPLQMSNAHGAHPPSHIPMAAVPHVLPPQPITMHHVNGGMSFPPVYAPGPGSSREDGVSDLDDESLDGDVFGGRHRGVKRRREDDDSDSDASGFHPSSSSNNGGMPNKQRPAPRFECEACGAMIGTRSNLERHRTQSCSVLRKGQPPPPGYPKPVQSLPSKRQSVHAAGLSHNLLSQLPGGHVQQPMLPYRSIYAPPPPAMLQMNGVGAAHLHQQPLHQLSAAPLPVHQPAFPPPPPPPVPLAGQPFIQQAQSASFESHDMRQQQAARPPPPSSGNGGSAPQNGPSESCTDLISI